MPALVHAPSKALVPLSFAEPRSDAHVRGAEAFLGFEDAGVYQGTTIDDLGEATGRRERVRLGSRRVSLREFTRFRRKNIWGADLGCQGSLCTVLISSDDDAEPGKDGGIAG